MVMRTRMIAEIISSVSITGLRGGGEGSVLLRCFGPSMSKVMSLEFGICLWGP